MEAQRDYATTKKIKEQSLTIVFFVVIAMVIITSLLVSTRFDLTKNNVYSISPISREIIKDIENPIYIDYYISPKLVANRGEPQQIIDLLQEYSARSSGNVIFSEKDATKEDLAQDLERYKLEAKQVQIVDKDQAAVAIVYSGIVIKYLDRQRIIPFILEPTTIEYQITSKILEVYNDDERKIGILLLDDVLRYDGDLNTIEQVLSAEGSVEQIPSGAPISDEIDALFVIGGKTLDNDTAYYLDQYIMSGKGVFFAVDRAKVDLQRGLNVYEQDNLLLDMLEVYGVNVETKIVADELHKFLPFNNGRFQTIKPYSLWITVNSQLFTNKEHPLTANFGGLDMYWTSPLQSTSDNYTSLVNSSDKAWTLSPRELPPTEEGSTEETPPRIFEVSPDDPTNFVSFRNSNNTKSYSLIGQIQGNVKSALESGIIIKPQDVEADYISSVSTARMIIAGNVNFITNLYRASNAGYNFQFVSNASEWLSNNDKLLQIKSRTVRDVQLNKITDEQKKQSLALIVKLLNMVFLPLLIVVVAILMLYYRRKLSERKY